MRNLMRLLYIDDDVDFGRLVCNEFKRHGYLVEIAPNGEEGLACLRRGGVDVVALDHYMPGRDGLDTLAAIQGEPDPPPVIYVTGSEEGRVAIAALKTGATDYVIKDLEGEFLALLRAAIESALMQAKLRREKEAAEAELRAARDRFEALAAERAVLLREVNHRVGNSLQLISSFLYTQSSASNQHDVKVALAAAECRVRAAARLHQRLYTSDDVRSVALDQYLEVLMRDIESSSSAMRPGWLSLEADPVMIDPDRAVAVGVIITELTINAMKHAYPSGEGPVRVFLTKLFDSRKQLIIEDDGIGLGSKPSQSGVGHLIIEAMADKLGATIAFDNSRPGTRVLINFS